jgi:class 3 adenylate cyclase
VDIAAWLRDLGLEQYEAAFRDNAVDAAVLPELSEADLETLGVAPLGHRKKLLRAIAKLRVETGPSLYVAASRPPVSPHDEGERRQVTVLFADLVGYTALCRTLNAEELHALLGRFFEAVDRIVEGHGGHIDKHIDDCVMAVFGAPVAHGNDAERAVRTALAIRDAMPKVSSAAGRAVSAHIGIAGGQVVASGTGSASHREYTVTGESVNLASRLTDAAGTGEILVSEAVRVALGERLDCGEAGALTVKGFDRPVRAWRLLGLRAVGVDPRPFVGRGAELAQFGAALASCRATGRGQTIHVRGEAGIGKTRLIEEFQRAARAAGLACHTGLVLDFGTRTGRDATRALVRSVLGLDLASDAEAARAAAGAALADGLVAADDTVFLNDLLDQPQPTELRGLYNAMDNTTRSTGKRRVVTGLIERASRVQPRLLVIEDLHWADPLTLAHAAELAVTVAACPALLVLTARTEGDPLGSEWRGCAANCRLLPIDLAPLQPEEARALAEEFFAANAVFAERCVELAAGNPLFLEQLLRHAEETQESGVPGFAGQGVFAGNHFGNACAAGLTQHHRDYRDVNEPLFKVVWSVCLNVPRRVFKHLRIKFRCCRKTRTLVFRCFHKKLSAYDDVANAVEGGRAVFMCWRSASAIHVR